MDINTLRGIITILVMITFIGLVIWAWSKRNKADFDEAAQLPFADEELAARSTQKAENE
ncbi:cbb3-type cytochrome c oxidase subunit 3 [Hahella sp. SMD15-11]|uniref:Cbb3-type cytochrome c oxidase subunit 3 n=1 Tax=Thermohahella caldifontis TaxID=3142973 RepID=A0AB39UZD0_9GAMM